MKKTWLLVLTIALVACACVVFAACSNMTTPSNDSKQSGYALNFNTVYALAEENGYTGTLEDLVALFKGATGEDGVDGVGIVDAQVNRAGELVLMLSNNQTLNLGSIVGPEGKQGPKGEQGATGNGIDHISKTASEGLTDTYTIYYTNGTTSTFAVTNGKNGAVVSQDGQVVANGIAYIAKTATAGNVDTYTITFDDGGTYSFTVTNGSNGQNGQDGKNGRDGRDGKDGRGISSIAKTGTEGNVDTYIITYTDGGTFAFTVTNGQDGRDGQIVDEQGTIVQNGKDGVDGRGISRLYINDDGNLVIVYTDATEQVLTNVSFNVAGGESTPSTPDITPTYAISFNLNGGTTTHATTPVVVQAVDASTFFYDVSKAGYRFCGWQYNGVLVFDNSGNLVNNVSLASNMTFDALFADSNRAYLTITSNMPEAGDYSTGGEYNYNSAVDIHAHPYQGYEFVGWYYNGVTLSNQQHYNYKMWDKDVHIVAKFQYADFALDLTTNNQDKGIVSINPTGVCDYYDAHVEGIFDYKTAVTIAAYTKTDYRFLGWFNQNDELVTTDAVYTLRMPNYDYFLTAKWASTMYTITYNLNGGVNSEANPNTYAYEDNTITLTDATRDYYIFGGWYTNAGLTSLKTSIPKGSTGNLTLYAKWTPIPYTITYNLNGGTNGNNPMTYTVESDAIALANATRDYYTFDGWYTNAGLTSLKTSIPKGSTGNLTLYAKWTPITYTITYNLNGGTNDSRNVETYTVQTERVIYEPTRIGYTFAGWNALDEATMNAIGNGIPANMILEALWTPNAYTLTLENTKAYTLQNAKTYTSNNRYTVVVSPSNSYGTVYLQATETGNHKVNFYSNTNLRIVITNLTAGKLIASRYNESGSISFDCHDGDVLSVFYSGGGGYTDNLYLYYSGFDSDSPSDGYVYDASETASVAVTYDAAFTLPTLFREGYAFDGWYNGENKIVADTYQYDSTLTLSPRWALSEYGITYNLNGGTNNSDNPATYTVESDSIILADATRDHYIFEGWYTDADFTDHMTSIPKGSTGDVTLYAKWTPAIDDIAGSNL